MWAGKEIRLDRRHRAADLPGEHVRAAGSRRMGPHSIIRAAGIRLAKTSNRRSLRSKAVAAPWRLPRAWPPRIARRCCWGTATISLLAEISTAAPIACCIRSSIVPASPFRSSTRRISTRSSGQSRRHTKLLWIETPGNPLMSLTDIAACAEIAHRHGVLVAVDNTFATPVLTRPLELGADIVMHSATKYLGGHSDLLGGALVVADPALYDRLYFIQNATGAVMGPLEAFPLLARPEDAGAARPRAMPHGAANRRVPGGRSARGSGAVPRYARIPATKSPRDKWMVITGPWSALKS